MTTDHDWILYFFELKVIKNSTRAWTFTQMESTSLSILRHLGAHSFGNPPDLLPAIH